MDLITALVPAGFGLYVASFVLADAGWSTDRGWYALVNLMAAGFVFLGLQGAPPVLSGPTLVLWSLVALAGLCRRPATTGNGSTPTRTRHLRAVG